jgi:transposase
MRPSGNQKTLEQRRHQAVELLEQGFGTNEVARRFGVTSGAVSQWKAKYKQQGRDGLCATPNTGRPAGLNAKQKKRLLRLLLRSPHNFGFATELWTLERIGKVIRDYFGIDYDPSSVWHILRNLGWSCQKPQVRARERDEEAIEKWRKQDWPRIKKSPKKR